MYTHHKLLGLIIEQYGTRKAFAAAMGVEPITLLRKLNGQNEFKTGDISRICDLLSIPSEKIPEYFFDQKVNRE